MNHNRLFQIILDFIDEYELPSDASISTFSRYPDYVSVGVIVRGRNDAQDTISDQLLWETDSHGITTARIVFDGVDFTVQIHETDEQVAA